MKLLPPILCLILLASAVVAQDAATKQISSALTDLESQLTNQSIPTDLKSQCTQDIAAARASLKLRRALLALYTSRRCQIEVATFSAKPVIAGLGDAAIASEKQRLDSVPANTKRASAFIVAFADAAHLEAEHYHQTSRAAQSGNAVDLLARARATLDFENFVRELRFAGPKLIFEWKSLEPELTKLGSSAMRTYKAAGANADQAEFTRLKESIESAAELNHESKFEAALLKYLESEFYFGMIVTGAENEDLQHLRERSGELAKLMSSGNTDNSIGLLFSEIAAANLNPASGEPTTMQLKTGVVILNRVMPGYFDYLKRIGPAVKPSKKSDP